MWTVQSVLLLTLLALPTSAAICTTRWFDRDDASGVGDFETLSDLRKEQPNEICLHPTAIEAQTLDGTPASATGQTFNPFNPQEGFACINNYQKTGSCRDYKVRFTCPPDFCSGCKTRWFDRDDPSGYGDYETLTDLHQMYPNQICPNPSRIEARTLSGIPASQTGQVVSMYDTISGFACINQEQGPGRQCLDYMVQFTCPDTFCSGCTTRWFDRDDASGKGDYELLSNLRNEYPNEICDEPLAINVQMIYGISAPETGQKFSVFDAIHGFACVNEDQEGGQSCLDYKVQFTCPKTFC